MRLSIDLVLNNVLATMILSVIDGYCAALSDAGGDRSDQESRGAGDCDHLEYPAKLRATASHVKQMP
jgi:hypothetical protein